MDYSWDPSGPRIFGRWSIQRLGQKSDADSGSLESNRCAIEGDTLAKVTQLRQQVAQASSPAEAMAASDALSRQVAGIFAVAENYPDLKANTNFMQLQEELTNTENKISYARQLYNSVTSNYNVKLETFPTNVIAGMFGFKQAEFLQVPEEEKAVPKVDFSGLGD